ncbi:MAG TPA: hypothetical protein VEU62_13230 [Bryobacterales bacterium]|nr:hypothetical protein [Bryobacterales bacterium]
MQRVLLPAAAFCLAAALPLAAQRVSAGAPGEGPSPRQDPARMAELRATVPLTSGVREDDHPALCADGPRLWAAWVSFSETEGTDKIFVREFDGSRWLDAEEASDAPGDFYRPAVASGGQGSVWVVWPAQIGGNWDLYGRERHAGRWGKIERLTTDAAPDIEPQLRIAGDQLWLVWQSLRGGNSGIYYRVRSHGNWGPEGAVAAEPGNNWAPALAADSEGGVHVAWDTYRAGNYDVYLRSFRGGRWSGETPVAASPQLENKPALAADRAGRVWIAWETGPENWAGDSHDGGLRARRSIGLACWKNGRLYRLPEAQAQLDALWGAAGAEAPAPVAGLDGKLWLFFRTPINQNLLQAGVTSWEGAAWATPKLLINSEGRIEQRIATALDAAGAIVACYPAGSRHNIVYLRRFAGGRPAGEDRAPTLSPAPVLAPAPPRAARQHHTFLGYELVWGDLHRHTDISEDGGILDGSLVDTMRYALDAAGLDFLGITDHTRYLPRRYNFWRLQKVTDLFYAPGFFSPLHAYERSQYSPWGHRNVIHLTRNYVPVPASYEAGDPGVDPNGLFAALRGEQAITIPHTSAWANKQVSWDYYDPDIERLVEIYQGLRSTYEYAGAPDPAGRAVYEKDSPNFVWNALARHRKLGFIASSDHRSTHISFAAAYSKGVDRPSVFDALRSRRTYAATDKIELDFSIGGHIMGEEIALGSAPVLEVAARGTAPIDKVDVIKNNRFVYSVEPRERQIRFEFRDQEWKGEDCYFYIRLIQSDHNMAWSSPIWVAKKR